jgi:hypothetical protein
LDNSSGGDDNLSDFLNNRSDDLLQKSLGFISDTVLLETAGCADVSLVSFKSTGLRNPVQDHWLIDGSDIDNSWLISAIIWVNFDNLDVAVALNCQWDVWGADVNGQKCEYYCFKHFENLNK